MPNLVIHQQQAEAYQKKQEQTADNTPSISGVNVSGDFNEGTRGPDYFKNIKIDLIGENLTDDNFLTE